MNDLTPEQQKAYDKICLVTDSIIQEEHIEPAINMIDAFRRNFCLAEDHRIFIRLECRLEEKVNAMKALSDERYIY